MQPIVHDMLHFFTEQNLEYNETKHELQEFVDLSKISLLFSTTANAVSHILFMWALWVLYIKHYKSVHEFFESKWSLCKGWCCCFAPGESEKDKELPFKTWPLDPFNDESEEEDLQLYKPNDLYDMKKKNEEKKRKCRLSFFGKEDDRTNTPLQGERLCHYIIWLIIGLSILITTIVVFFTYQYHDAKNDNPMDYDDDFKMYFKLQISALILHAYALFRSLVSCFIFSKLMYGIQRRCEEIELYVYYINKTYQEMNVAALASNFNTLPTNVTTLETNDNTPDNVTTLVKNFNTLATNVTTLATNVTTLATNLDKLATNGVASSDRQVEAEKIGQYVIWYLDPSKVNTPIEMKNYANDTIINDNAMKYLKKRDRHFIEKALATLSWLQLWFLFHWLLHIISTFMIMTVLVDAVTLHVKARVPHLEPGVDFHPGEIGFLFMYSLMQCFFLFYPCLRAASVTRTRQRVIRIISEKAKDDYSNIPPGVLNEFIESMKRRKFSFRLRILCARIPFNMNIAYLSIAFGFVGVVVSLITSVTS